MRRRRIKETSWIPVLVIIAGTLISYFIYSNQENSGKSELKEIEKSTTTPKSGPYVIFKFDDLNDKGVPWQGFKAIGEICKEKGAKCTMGIFGQSLERGDSAYFHYLRTIVNDPDIEIWMHGYNGESDELLGNLSYQKWAFAKTRWNLLYYLDYLPRTFSPH